MAIIHVKSMDIIYVVHTMHERAMIANNVNTRRKKTIYDSILLIFDDDIMKNICNNSGKGGKSKIRVIHLCNLNHCYCY